MNGVWQGWHDGVMYELDRDTIADTRPKYSHVERRLEYIESGRSPLKTAKVKDFTDFIPNLVLAARLWTVKAHLVHKYPDKDITPQMIMEEMSDRFESG